MDLMSRFCLLSMILNEFNAFSCNWNFVCKGLRIDGALLVTDYLIVISHYLVQYLY
jgi:hypothetical protein